MPPGVAPLDEMDPTSLGPYQLLGRLGDGGMGSVYLARRADGPDARPLVAVKVIRPDLARIPQFRERFLREAQAARRVAPFCTAAVLDVATDGARPYLVTEYIDGPTLGVAVRERGPLATGELDRLLINIASALTAIHAAGVVHRDLKPGNILLSSSGARVIDFGVARALDNATLTQGSIGTPGFMAPEQALGRPAATPADIYAWGAVTLFAATGRTPFGNGPTPVILHRVVHDTPDLTGIPGALRPLVAQAMAKKPAERPSAEQLLLALHHLRGVLDPDSSRGAAPHLASLDTAETDAASTGPLPVPAPATPPPTWPAGEAAPTAQQADHTSPRQDPAITAPPTRRRSARRRPGNVLIAALATAIVAAVAIPAIILTTGGGDGTGGSPGTSPTTPVRTATTTTAGRLAATAPSPYSRPLLGDAAEFLGSRTVAVRDVAAAGTIHFYNVTDPGDPVTIGGTTTDSWGFASSSDGHILAAEEIGAAADIDVADNQVRLWNVTDLAHPVQLGEAFTVAQIQNTVHLALSPDGHILATAADTVQLWDITEPTRPSRIGGPVVTKDAYGPVAFSPDGRTLATTGAGAFQLWNVTNPASPIPLTEPVGAGHTARLLFARGGHLLVVLGGDIRIWDLAKPTAPTPVGPPISVGETVGTNDIALSPDGTTLAFAGSADQTVRFWDVTDPAKPHPVGQTLPTSGNWVRFSPDGRVLIAAESGDKLRLWNLH